MANGGIRKGRFAKKGNGTLQMYHATAFWECFATEKRAFMNVLKRINTLRLERGWSVYRLSVEAGLPQSTMINMFNRETMPSLATLESLCRAFGISLSDFFRDDSLPKPPAEEAAQLFRSLPEAQAEAVLTLLRELDSANKKGAALAPKQEK